MQWLINELLVTNDVAPDMVTRVNYSVTDTQDGLVGKVTYAINILPADPNNYTPYSDVTEAQAIGWVQDTLGASGIASMEQQVQASIDIQKIPVPQPAPLPWATSVTET